MTDLRTCSARTAAICLELLDRVSPSPPSSVAVMIVHVGASATPIWPEMRTGGVAFAGYATLSSPRVPFTFDDLLDPQSSPILKVFTDGDQLMFVGCLWIVAELAARRDANPRPIMADLVLPCPINPIRLEWLGGQFAASQQPEGGPFLDLVASTRADLHGAMPKLKGVAWASDLRLPTDFGGGAALHYGPTLRYGPGDLRCATR